MKIFILKSKLILKSSFILVLLLLCYSVFLLTTRYFSTSETISTANLLNNEKYDLDGDGINDSIEKIDGQNKIDYYIKCNKNKYELSQYIDDNILFTLNNTLYPSVIVYDISRDKIPELILQGSKYNQNISYIFHFENNKFILSKSTNKNIVGILDSKNSKTPQVIFINSKDGISSSESYMLVNKDFFIVNNNLNSIPGFESSLKFINLVELPYTVDELPDIFSANINHDELSLLWTLDKDNNNYAFQNAFFYDYEYNSENKPIALRWKLSFKKNSLKGNEGDNSEIKIFLDIKEIDSYYKITNIKIQK